MAAIYIWVRSTVDWGDAAAFRAQLAPAFAPHGALWDATFTMPFHVFRQRVKEIAAQCKTGQCESDKCVCGKDSDCGGGKKCKKPLVGGPNHCE